MDIRYTVLSPFKTDFLKIKCADFKNKKELFQNELNKFKEKRLPNFYSNKNSANLEKPFTQIFEPEIDLMKSHFNSKINIQKVWSVSYDHGDYHIPHNHGSIGYAGILYFNMEKNFHGQRTIYLQPWNNQDDKSVLFEPDVEEGDIMIVPQFILHFTRPNLSSGIKRIVSFDFKI